ncbi:MAG: hypothetical protein C6I00_02350 [Nitratiruptor sp.]|nr:hypothetical protein [Nitratiruptor sp.]NPA84127.1 hypothetical protein [Campylobacterota bacterium]
MPLIWFLFALPLLAQDLLSLWSQIEEAPSYRQHSSKIEAQILTQQAQTFNANPRISLALGYGESDEGPGKMEYEVGIGRDLFVGGDLKGYMRHSKRYGELIQLYEANRLKIELWRLYGRHCLIQESLQAKRKLRDLYAKMADHIETGVRLGEFGANEALMARLELRRLELELTQIAMELDRFASGIASLIPSFDGHFVCTLPPLDRKALFEPENSLAWRVYQERKLLLQRELDLRSKPIQTLGLDLTLAKELDAKRASLSLSIPLATSSSTKRAKEAARKELLAAHYELERFTLEYRQERERLKRRLQLYQQRLQNLESSMEDLAQSLVEQSQKRFLAGEEGVLGLLKALESRLALVETILQTKLDHLEAIAEYMERYGIEIERVFR